MFSSKDFKEFRSLGGEAASIMADSNDVHEGADVAPVDGSTLNELQVAIMDALDSSGALGE
jgi:hypothetical protein